jgi:hypothetical protein
MMNDGLIMRLKEVCMARKRLPDEEELSPLSIRIPLSLRELIEQSARRHRRSLNQEVILWLERAAQDFETPVAQAPAAQPPAATTS